MMTDELEVKQEQEVVEGQAQEQEVAKESQEVGEPTEAVDMRTPEEKREDDNRAGVKAGAGDLPDTSEEAEEIVEDVGPMFFVEDDDRIKVEMNVVWNPQTGRIVYVSKHDEMPDVEKLKVLRILSSGWSSVCRATVTSPATGNAVPSIVATRAAWSLTGRSSAASCSSGT